MFDVAEPPERLAEDRPTMTRVATILNGSPQLSRNAPCLCGSGRKFKRCYLKPPCKKNVVDFLIPETSHPGGNRH